MADRHSKEGGEQVDGIRNVERAVIAMITGIVTCWARGTREEHAEKCDRVSDVRASVSITVAA